MQIAAAAAAAVLLCTIVTCTLHAGAETDRLDECILPTDWEAHEGSSGYIRDGQLAQLLLQQLPQGAVLHTLFDCCFSGERMVDKIAWQASFWCLQILPLPLASGCQQHPSLFKFLNGGSIVVRVLLYCTMHIAELPGASVFMSVGCLYCCCFVCNRHRYGPAL
jgi:hypothetical protein